MYGGKYTDNVEQRAAYIFLHPVGNNNMRQQEWQSQLAECYTSDWILPVFSALNGHNPRLNSSRSLIVDWHLCLRPPIKNAIEEDNRACSAEKMMDISAYILPYALVLLPTASVITSLLSPPKKIKQCPGYCHLKLIMDERNLPKVYLMLMSKQL